MLDAWGKPSAGIRRFYLTWLGNFEECRSAKSNTSAATNVTFATPVSFEGKYCGVGASIVRANDNPMNMSK